jgi:APA family basic amino acid/polyamine antiporter
LFVGGVSLLGPFVGKYALAPIVNTGSFVFTIALAVTCAASIALRKSSPGLDRPFRARMPILYLGAVISVFLLLLMILPQSPGQLGNLEFMIVGIWVLLGLIAFYWRQSRHPLTKEERDYLILGDFS